MRTDSRQEAVDASRMQEAGQSSQAVQGLLQASASLLTAADRSVVFSGILDFAGNVLSADGYAVWHEFPEQSVWRAVAYRGLSAKYRTSIPSPPKRIENVARVVEDVLTDPALQAFREDYLAEGIRSMLVMPLFLTNGSSGTLTFYWRRVMSFSGLDMKFAEALANLCSAAINTIELREKTDRERSRLSFLAEVSTILASSLDYETTLERVARLAVPEIADWCTVHVVEDGAVNRLVVAHADAAMLQFAEEYSRKYPEEIREDRGLGRVLRTGEPEFYARVTDEMLQAASRSPEHLGDVKRLGIHSSILAPLTSRGRILGAIRLMTAGEERHYSEEDLQLALDLARRAATAIDNAQLHREVLKQGNELRLCHAAARMGSWSWDLKRQEIFWSDEFKLLHGLPTHAESGYAEGSVLIHPEDRERVLTELRETLISDADKITSEHRVLTPDGRTLVVLSIGTIQRDERGEACSILGVSVDVTEQRRAEEALRRTEKLAMAGRMAATVAHEVNNPLEALTNLVYLASVQDGLPATAKEYLQSADEELKRMTHIVRQTLGFYRESARPRKTAIREIVAEVVNLYRSRAAARSIELTLCADFELTLLVNAGEIRQVLANLVANAIDATPPGGAVRLNVDEEPGEVRITVKDTGTGISEENLSRIFEAFFTTKEEVGTGLGLWVSKSIIERYNGTIQVVSDVTPASSGTTFIVTLPITEQPDSD